MNIHAMTQQEQSSGASGLPTCGEVASASHVHPLSIPLVDTKVVAGFPVPLSHDEFSQEIDILSMLCPHPDSTYLIRVRGLSMIDAGVHDGDIVIVDKSMRYPTEKQIAVCELNGEYTLKRVQRHDGKLWLVPANPDYPNIEVSECDDFSVWGVVTYIIHKAIY